MELEDQKIALTPERYMEFIDSIDDIVLGENPFDYLQELPTFTMGAYLHIPSLGDSVPDFPKRLYHRNLPQVGIDEFIQATYDRLPPCAKSCFANRTFSWLTDIIDAPTTPAEDQKALESYLKFNRDGLCIPLYGPHNSNGYIFIGTNKEKSEFGSEWPYQVIALVQLIHNRFRQVVEARKNPVKLTPRELEVLELICLGKTNSEIAIILSISSNTVSGYVSRVFLKLGVSDRVSAAMRRQAMEIVD